MSIRTAPSPGVRLTLLRLAFAAAVIVLWQVVTASGAVPKDALATPSSIANVLVDIVPTGVFWSSVGATALNWWLGVGIAFAIAVPLGFVLGAVPVLYELFTVPIEFMRTVPSVALLPVVLLLYGATGKMVVLLVALGAVWPLLLQSMYGIHQVDPLLEDVAAVYHLSVRERVGFLLVPGAAPFVATGLRISVTIGLLLCVSAEILGGAPGLGREIALSQQTLVVSEMYAYIVVVALMGTVVNLLMLKLERTTLSWHPSQRNAT